MESIENLKYAILNEWTDDPPAGCVTIYYDAWFESLSEVKPLIEEIIDHVKNAIGYEEEYAEVANTAESIGWDMDFEDGYIDLLKRLHDGQCLTVGFPAEGFVDLREGIDDIFDKAEETTNHFGDASPSWSAEMTKIYHALKKIIDPEHKILLTINPKRLPPARSRLRDGPGVDVFSCLFIYFARNLSSKIRLPLSILFFLDKDLQTKQKALSLYSSKVIRSPQFSQTYFLSICLPFSETNLPSLFFSFRV